MPVDATGGTVQKRTEPLDRRIGAVPDFAMMTHIGSGTAIIGTTLMVGATRRVKNWIGMDRVQRRLGSMWSIQTLIGIKGARKRTGADAATRRTCLTGTIGTCVASAGIGTRRATQRIGEGQVGNGGTEKTADLTGVEITQAVEVKEVPIFSAG